MRPLPAQRWIEDDPGHERLAATRTSGIQACMVELEVDALTGGIHGDVGSAEHFSLLLVRVQRAHVCDRAPGMGLESPLPQDRCFVQRPRMVPA